ncbi:hypothetical protein HAZT_HAZT007234 [Hyalella azteca]|uniref:C2H2-type domain-containing protein n=1 Tax=Hyalella azteca TaxID=294128 RepID=A0A6A0GYK6_HYAAZ|nr:hypothetical protein HAZT_HAZT007234 [Hyalella azteca]
MSPEDAPTTSPLAGEEGPSSNPNNASSGASSPSNTFNLTCMTCHTHFTSAELYARHDCVNSNSSAGDVSESSVVHNSSGDQTDMNRSGSTGDDSGIIQSESEPMIQENSSDVERFDGKIVYNPDGSAYIFDSEMSEDDAVGLDIQPQEGSIIDSPNNPLPETVVPSIPPIANAFYVTKNTRAFYNALYGQTLSSLIPEKKGSEVPIVHSYRVISVGDKDRESECKDNSDSGGSDSALSVKSDKTKLPLLDYAQVPIKPILMCFVCKLSFGYVRSFISHAMGDHNIVLSEEEKNLLATKNVSAILQVSGRDKDPRISFLEPVTHPGPSLGPGQACSSPSEAPSGPNPDQQQSSNAETNQSSQNEAQKQENPEVIEDDVPEPMETETSSLCVKREIDLFEQVPRSMHHSQPPNLTLPPHLQQFHPSHHGLHLPPPSSPFATPQHPAGMRTPDMSRKSPISALGSNGGRSSLSPVTSMSPTSFSPLPSPITQLTGTIIGACPEHMSGRQQGISCDKCDLIMQQSRQLSGQMAFMHSRNSCKTLKCPKCNWHYKYQETLEIHMKEKHPENESTCIYCLTSQPHPRLARGETYTCGYKPYRCEVCNYSTTTKGNLSIHMQSDKHLNNMQELQNGGIPNMESGVVTPQSQMMSQVSQQSPSSSSCAPKVSTPSSTCITPPSHQKPKPMWRCDVCNYETNVARNLRIHMTSEKHTHNMMVLQQNVKHMQQLSAMPDPMALLQMSQGGMLHEKPPPPPPEVAMADLAYNQALLIQMISGGGQMGAGLGSNPLAGLANQEHMGPHFDLGINPEALEPPPEPVPPNPRAVYTCCVCSNFNTDSLEQLNIHLQFDRSKLNENEVLLIVAGNYICKLCSYKTNLKANFQLHCKTDKHLQKLQYVNHILEGGPRNEWKLKYLANTNPLHVRCNLCEFYTNSVHKLQLHSAHQRHEVLAMLFKHLSSPDHPVPLDRRQFRCCLCNFSTKARLELLHHIRSVRHLQMEQLHQLQRHAEGKSGTHQDIGDIFRVEEEEDLSTSRGELCRI